jgi:predicted transcriptional regulator
MNHEQRLLQAWTPAPLADRFTSLARRRDRSISAELRQAIREHLAREHEEDARQVAA